MHHDSLSKTILWGTSGGWATPWSAEEMLDWRQRMDVPTYARTAEDGLLQNRLENDLCWIVPHVPLMTHLFQEVNCNFNQKIAAEFMSFSSWCSPCTCMHLRWRSGRSTCSEKLHAMITSNALRGTEDGIQEEFHSCHQNGHKKEFLLDSDFCWSSQICFTNCFVFHICHRFTSIRMHAEVSSEWSDLFILWFSQEQICHISWISSDFVAIFVTLLVYLKTLWTSQGTRRKPNKTCAIQWNILWTA